MKKLLLILIYLGFISSLFSQFKRQYETNPDKKRANIWYFGKNAGIDFNYSPPKPLTDGKVNTIEACASICDTSGRLLLYTDGDSIWGDKNNNLKGNLIMDKSATQGVLILPNIDFNTYYFFSIGYNSNVNKSGLWYSEYNITNTEFNVLNEIVLLNFNANEQLTSINHQNGRFFWLTYRGNKDSIMYFLITNNGLVKKPYFKKSSIASQVGYAGAMKHSIDGKLIAINNIVYDINKHDIELVKFNSESAELDSHILITNIFLPYGLEFSSNSKYLYVSESSRKLVQFSLKNYQKDSINNSRRVLADISGYDQIQGLQMGPDGNIYLFGHDSLFLGRIVNPDSANARFEGRGLYLGGQRSEYGSPNFLQSIFYTPSIDFRYKYDCTENTVSFDGLDTFNSTNHLWKVKKKFSNQGQSIYNGKQLSVTFQDSGIYTINYIASNSNKTDSIAKEITILSRVKKDFLGKDTSFCKNSVYHVKANAISSPDVHSYQWSTGDSSRSIDISSSGSYSVIVTLRSVCQVLDTITVSEISLPAKTNITRTGDTLTLLSTINDSIAWYRDGVFLSSDHSGRLTVEEKGRYYARVFNAQDCFSSSDTIVVDKLSDIKSIKFSESPQVYPNPFAGTLEIESKNPITSVIITGIDGTTILEKTVSESKVFLDTVSIFPGLYLCRISLDNGQVVNLLVCKN